MINQSLSSIINIRYQLLKRLLFSKRATAVWLPVFISVLSFVIFIIYFLISKGVMAAIISIFVAKDIGVLPGVLFGFLVFISILVTAYVLIVGTQLKDSLNYKNISFLPLNYFFFYLTEIIASFCDIWVLLLIPILVGIFIGLGLFSGVLSVCLSLSLLIIFIVTIGVFNQLLVSLIEFLLKFSRIKLIRSVFILLFIILLSFLIMSPIFLIGNDPDELSSKMTDILYNKKLYLTPIGLITDGLINLVENDFTSLLSFTIPLVLIYIFVFLFAGYKISKFSPARKAQTKSKSKSVTNLLGNIDRIFNLFSKRNFVLLAKEIVYLLRSSRIKYFFVLGLLFIASQLISHASANRSNEIFIIIFLSYPFLVFVMDSGYLYAYDDKAAKSNFFSPHHYKDIILGKNVSLLLLVFLFQLFFYVAILIIWDSVFGIKVILASFFLGCYLAFSNFITINYISITNPPKIKFNSIFGRGSSNVGMSLLSVLLSVTPVIICFIFFHDSIILLIISFIILCIISIILYAISLKPLSEKLVENQEHFIKQISG